jgi:hypothetical protein
LCHEAVLGHLDACDITSNPTALVLDAVTVRNLELVAPVSEDASEAARPRCCLPG